MHAPDKIRLGQQRTTETNSCQFIGSENFSTALSSPCLLHARASGGLSILGTSWYLLIHLPSSSLPLFRLCMEVTFGPSHRRAWSVPWVSCSASDEGACGNCHDCLLVPNSESGLNFWEVMQSQPTGCYLAGQYVHYSLAMILNWTAWNRPM